jgi:hypothetical protein
MFDATGGTATKWVYRSYQCYPVQCRAAQLLTLTPARIMQNVMNLSADQKKSLREEFARVIGKSAALHRERAVLLRTLDVRMTSDDGHTTERISQARRLERCPQSKASAVDRVLEPEGSAEHEILLWPGASCGSQCRYNQAANGAQARAAKGVGMCHCQGSWPMLSHQPVLETNSCAQDLVSHSNTVRLLSNCYLQRCLWA